MVAVVGIIGRHTYTIEAFLPIGGIGVTLTGQAIHILAGKKENLPQIAS